MLENYSVESIKDILPYKFDVEVRDIDVYLTINNDFRIYFQQIQSYHLFCFLIKRAFDFGVISNNTKLDLNELKQYVALDDKLNILITTNTFEFEKGLLTKRIKTFLDTGEHAFWGNIQDDELYIKVGNQYIKKVYSYEKTNEFKTKVLIQPGDFDSSIIVYIDDEYKPKESLRVVLTFKKNEDSFVFTGAIKSDWIY
jgi:hypothetical protein